MNIFKELLETRMLWSFQVSWNFDPVEKIPRKPMLDLNFNEESDYSK